MRLIKGKTYRIQWFDIHHFSEWGSLEEGMNEVRKIKPIDLKGQVYVGSTPDFWVFTSGRAGDGDLYDVNAIPKKMIYKITVLR